MVWHGNTDELDEVVGALRSARRRHALYYLREREAVDIETLAGVLAAWEAVGDGNGTAVRRDHDRVYTALHHSELPKLADAGLVTVDREAGTVESDLSALAEDLLECVFDHDRLPPDPDADVRTTGSGDAA